MNCTSLPDAAALFESSKVIAYEFPLTTESLETEMELEFLTSACSSSSSPPIGLSELDKSASPRLEEAMSYESALESPAPND